MPLIAGLAAGQTGVRVPAPPASLPGATQAGHRGRAPALAPSSYPSPGPAPAPPTGDWACSVAARVALPGKPPHALRGLLSVASPPPAARLPPGSFRSPRPRFLARPRPARSQCGSRGHPVQPRRGGRTDRVQRRRRARSTSACGGRGWRPGRCAPGPAELPAAAGVRVSRRAWGRPRRCRGARGECPWRAGRW